MRTLSIIVTVLGVLLLAAGIISIIKHDTKYKTLVKQDSIEVSVEQVQDTIVLTEEQVLAKKVSDNYIRQLESGYDEYGNKLELMQQEVIMSDDNVLTVRELLEMYEEVNH